MALRLSARNVSHRVFSSSCAASAGAAARNGSRPIIPRTFSSSAATAAAAESMANVRRASSLHTSSAFYFAAGMGLAFWATQAPAPLPVAEAKAVGTASAYLSSATAAAAHEDPGCPAGAKCGPIINRSGRAIDKLRVFIGYDSREDIAYQVARYSILKHATCPVEIIPIKQSELRKAGVYTRGRDPTESTEFSFTRFLTPFLGGYEGWAMFVDCDFLYTADIRELGELLDDQYAVMCVQHNYVPKTDTKMDGVVQTKYPRKNWSSMVLYNCGHPKNRVLTPDVVNSQSGAFLHRFQWLEDKDIGAIPCTWNHLCGHNEAPADGRPPKAIHYTLGGPWFDAWKDVEYGDLWTQTAHEYKDTARIHKIIQVGLMETVSGELEKQKAALEKRMEEMAEAQREMSATQRLLMFHLQDKHSSSPMTERKPQVEA